MLNQQKEKLWISVSEKSENMICKIINDTIIDWYGMFYLIIYFLFECLLVYESPSLKKLLEGHYLRDLLKTWWSAGFSFEIFSHFFEKYKEKLVLLKKSVKA